jgi:hypothetical protein
VSARLPDFPNSTDWRLAEIEREAAERRIGELEREIAELKKDKERLWVNLNGLVKDTLTETFSLAHAAIHAARPKEPPPGPPPEFPRDPKISVWGVESPFSKGDKEGGAA